MLSERVSVIGSTEVTTPTGATAGFAAMKSRIAWILVSIVVAAIRLFTGVCLLQYRIGGFLIYYHGKAILEILSDSAESIRSGKGFFF